MDEVARPHASPASLHAGFSLQVRRAPDAIAVQAGARRLTYAQLERMSERFARRLAAHGVQPGQRVGVQLERSPERLAALLALLRLGAVCVPFDADAPRPLVARLREAVGAQPMLVQRARPGALTAGLLIELEGLDDGDDEPRGVPPAWLHPDAPAWLLCATDQPARPHGVLLRQAGLLRAARLLALDERDSVAQLAPLASAAALVETWGALLQGARLVLTPPQADSWARLAALVRAEAVSTLVLPVGAFEALAQRQPDELRGVRQIVLTGAPAVASLRRVLGVASAAQVFSAFAPHAAAPFVTLRRLSADEAPDGATLVLGEPLEGQRVALLDDAGRPVPQDLAGELCVAASDGGWLPWREGAESAPRPDDDWLRSGALARRLPGGALELLGRRDRRRVTACGREVSPEALEECLAELPGVRGAVVIAGRGLHDEARLRAYVEASPDSFARDEALARVSARFAEHAWPSSLVVVERLSLLPDGRPDEAAMCAAQASDVAPMAWPAMRTAPGDGHVERVELWTPGLRERLVDWAEGRGVTPRVALLGAALEALAAACGRRDLALVLRGPGQAEHVLGRRARVLRLRLGQGSWSELVQAAARAAREALPSDLDDAGEAHVALLCDCAHHPDGPTGALGARHALALYVGCDHGAQAWAGVLADGRVTPGSCAALVELWRRALSALVAHPEQPHAAFDKLSPAQRRTLLDEWNERRAAFPVATLPELFREQARRHVASPAVSGDGLTWSYAELDARVQALARRLRGRGVRRGTRVALYLERRPECLVAVLAVLAAGGVYVPLERAYPAERLAHMLADSQAALVVTRGEWAAELAALAPPPLLLLDDETSDAADDAAGALDLAPDLRPEDGAYVIYTSGSTGRPKGVLVSHANVARLFAAARTRFDFDERDVWTWFHSYAFDFSVWEIWGALLHGGRLVVVPRETSRAPDEFHALLRREGVSVLNQTPSAFRQLARADEDAGTPPLALRHVVFGGEALELASLRPWFERRGDRQPRLTNMYGITETTVHVTFRPLGLADVEPGAPSVIGRALPDLQVYVLDAALEPLPPGAPGELHVGGAGLAQGYLGRPDLTAERFVPDPFALQPGARLYRSGDLARWLPGGELEYLGRADQQVKLRGYRIELGEIESALGSHPALAEAAVTLREDLPGERRLVAYVVPRAGHAPTVVELRAHLETRLPEPMLPAAFVNLERLPLNANGKLDRASLPAPEHGALLLGTAYVAPRTPVEELLAAVWAEVLDVPRVGVHDNFFDLGGDSMRSVHVRAEAEERGLSFALHELLAHPTIAELALALAAGPASSAGETRTSAFDLAPAEARARLGADVEDAYPLTGLQAGMLFHSQLAPDSAVYHDVFHCELEAPFDLDCWERAAAQVTRRHPILRTSFDLLAPGGPLQVVAREARLPLQCVDLRGLSTREQAARLREFAERERLEPFDWRRAPLLRLFLHRLDARRLRCTFSFHHAILDGWSLATLTTELARAYAEHLRGTPRSLPPPAATLRDHVALEREAARSDEMHAFWERALFDHHVARLPRLRVAQDGEARSIRRVPVRLGAETAAGLRRVAASEGVPLKSVLVAAYVKALAVTTGERDVVLGMLFNGRPERDGAQEVLGLFLNTLPLRVALPNGSWRALVRLAFEAEREIVPRRRYPLTEIKQRLGGETPFEVAFNFTHFHVYEQFDEDLGVRLLERDIIEESNFALVLQTGLQPGSDVPHAVVEADASALDEAQTQALAQLCGRVLAALAEHPDRHHDALACVAPEVAWPQPHLPSEATLAQAFAAQAAATPQAPALVGAGVTLTFAELTCRVNQLARRLAGLGIGPGTLVALCAERSCDLFVALLAILEAGAAYLPLDPDYPQERLEFMLEDSGAVALVTQTGVLGRLPAYPLTLMRVLCLDEPEERARCAAESDAPLALPGQVDALAYVIYTSGSTGRPKGVAVPHRGLLQLARELGPVYDLRPGDHVLQFASSSFDASAYEWIVTLLNGAALAVPERETVLDPLALTEFLNRHRVALATLPPSYLRTLQPASLPHLRALAVAGEACAPELAAEWGVGRRFFNAYGPTEASVCTSIHEWRGAAVLGGVPIGRPLSHAPAYVLDAAGNPLPTGTPGELYVGGACLARGYLGRPELTAERFVPDPFAGRPGARLYRTGDLARLLPGGELLFLGRVDQQVKVRGFRVETGEVESALRSLAGVAEAAVVGRQDGASETRLVAYVVPSPGAPAPSAAELAAGLQARLPGFMLPAAFVTLDALPLGPTGKLDRRRLPAPVAGGGAGSDYVAPRTPTERALAEIWQSVLGHPRVSRQDNFFLLGGDSILSIQVRAEAQARGLDFALRDLLRAPTLAALAELSERAGAVPPADAAPLEPFALLLPEQRALLPEDLEDAYPLSQLQDGMLFHLHYDPSAGLYHDIMHFELGGRFDAALLRTALERLTARHPALRTSFELQRFDTPLQLVHRAAPVHLRVHDLRALDAAGQARVLADAEASERARRFDLRRPSLLTVDFYWEQDERGQLTLSCPHAILDGWSVASLMAEWLTNYAALLRGGALPDEPPLRAGMRDFVALELRARESAASAAFWDAQLADFVPTRVPSLGTPAGRDAARLDLELAPGAASGLRSLARRSDVPLKSLLLALHLKALSVLGGGTDVVTGLISNGRPESADGARALGLFLNALPVRLRLPACSWGRLAREVFALEQAQLPHRLFPMPEMRRRQAGLELFEHAFNYTHFHAYERLDAQREVTLSIRGGLEYSNFALVFQAMVMPRSEQLRLLLDCDAARYDAADRRRVAAVYEAVVAAALRAPDERHDLCDCRPAAEQRLGAACNATGRPRDALGFDELFAEVVRRQAGALALRDAHETLTYAQVDERARRLAARLRALGAGPDVCVALGLERSARRALAALGVLLAGAAFVSLDPDLPAERLALLLADCRAALIVTDAALARRWPNARARIVTFEDEPRAAGAPSAAPATTDARPEHLAYLIYTSGSTGEPKGVGVSRAGLLNMLAEQRETLALGPGDVLLQFASPAFDASVWELCSALFSGAALCVPPRAALLDRDAFAPTLREWGVNAALLPPSFLSQFELHELEPLRLLVVGGESCPPALAERLRHGRRLFNFYGPSEASIYATSARLDGAELPSSVPIGLPIGNLQAHVLDAAGQPCALGAVGELWLGGVGLARGYLGRPELTAAAFRPDPFASRAGARLYRTGDLARRLADGSLECLGRVDQQLKLRGVRIEPGEIEEALRRHAGLRDAVVLAHGEGLERRLVAYVEPAGPRLPQAHELREALRGHLGDALIPAQFEVLARLPRTPSGKLDRRALPQPRRASARAHVPPRTPTEAALAEAWAALLHVERVGADDDFFELGGHSLVATQLVSRLRRVLGLELELRTLFEEPRLRDLARALDASRRPAQRPPLVRGPAGDAPLSSAQQRLWFLEQLQPGLPTYNFQQAWRLGGRLERAALERALARVVERHAVLRTRFVSAGGRTLQRVFEPHFHLPLLDLSHLEADARARTWRALLEREALRPFDLEQAGPLRAALVYLAPDEHVLFLGVHHVAWDGWSLGVFVRELEALYAAALRGLPDGLPEPVVQYADYARWQQDFLRDATLEAQLDHWRASLRDAHGALELPGDRARPAVKGFRGARLPVRVRGELRDELAALARSHDATLYMVLLAAFQALLGRFARQEHVLVATPVAGRAAEESEALIGFFVNLLVMHGDLRGDPSFVTLLQRTRAAALAAYEHQDVPFEQLVDALQPGRDTSRPPLCQVAFALQTFGHVEDLALRLEGLQVRSEEPRFEVSRFDLTLNLIEASDALVGGLEYDVALLDQRSATRLLDAYVRLLGQLAARAHEPLSRLELLSPAERELLLVTWNRTASDYPRTSLAAEFEAQARRAPQAPALVELDQHGQPGRTLTYGALEAAANRLARALRARSVAPGALVGVCLERSLELIVGLLAIQKAGAAYLPLDPSYPRERLDFMLRDACPALTLVHGVTRQALPDETRVLALDAERDWIAAQDESPLGLGAALDQLAYVVYTSGSTGVPKGVMVPQRGVLRLVKQCDYVSIAPYDVFLQLAPVAFDASTFEIWGALLNGARLVLAPARALDLARLDALLGEQRISVLWLTAPLFHALVSEGGAGLRGVRQVLAGGDVLAPERVRAHLSALAPEQALINGYGPTENTTFTACARLDELPAEAPSVPLGRPIANTRVYLLDAALQPVPLGVPGELCTAGDGLARGYLARPDATAESFVPDPFGAPGERLYRTGDLARWRADGTLQFLGRLDGQVKVRGHRIEPGEVEAALLRLGSVRQAAVAARERDGDRQLVAYVVPRAGSEVDALALQAQLRRHLPEYLLPTLFVAVAALPLTPTGKLDRRALPAPADASAALAAAPVEPRTPAERALCQVFARVLGVPRVGLTDNYFALGGDSMLSLQLKAEAQAAGFDFPLQALFEHQTVEALAAVVAGQGDAERSADVAPFALVSPQTRAAVPDDVEDAYPLSQLQAGLLFQGELAAGSGLYHDIIEYRVRAPFDEARLRAALAEAVARHPMLRTSFDLTSFAEPVQLVRRAVALPLVVRDLRALPETQHAARLAEALDDERRSDFDWTRAPLLRVLVARLSDDVFQLGLSFHHAILDGWSEAALVAELLRPEAAGGAPRACYRDFVALEREALASADQRAFWETALHDVEPTSLPRWPLTPTADARPQRFLCTLERELHAQLAELARGLEVPLKTVLLTAHVAALAAITGRREVVTGLASHGRPESGDGERVLGLFLNVLPLRVALGERSLRALVAEVFAREQALFERRRYPVAARRRAGGQAPLFESVFNFTHFHVWAESAARVESRAGFVATSLELVVNFQLTPDGAELAFSLETGAELSGRARLDALAELHLQALRALAAHAQAPAALEPPPGDLATLTRWNATARPYAHVNLMSCFAEQVRRRPSATAVVALDDDGRPAGSLTYLELQRRASRLARLMRARGVTPGERVALALPRSLDMLVTLVATLQAGAVYVALEPELPAQRRDFMLRDSGARLLVARAGAGALAATVATLDLGLAAAELERCDDAPLAVDTRLDDLAYLAYTSGSTGVPKGVAVTQRGVLRLVQDPDYVSLDAADVCLQIAPLAFDASTFEIWGALLAGARLVLAPPGPPDPALLARVLREQGISVLWQTTPLFHLMVEQEPEALRGVRQVLTGGDVTLPGHVRRHLTGLPAQHRLVLAYGPTENTTFSTCVTLRELAQDALRVPIGRPIANTRMHVLDAQLRPVPLGTPGELYIAGDGLAWGYWARPELTAERFLPDPFGPPGSRLFRSGDAGRHLPDGTLEFLGRLDTQVKLRGLRVELGEVEAALGEHPALRAGAVAVHGSGSARRLVAYVVPQASPCPGPDELRAFLAQRLPEYMLPADWVELDALPLGPSGKLDRRALREPAARAGLAPASAPRSPEEELLCGLWCEVLGLTRVGLDDDFFACGGQSLSAMQLVSRVRRTLGIELPLRRLFERPSVRGLARVLSELRGARPLPAIARRGLQRVPLSYAQQRLWFVEQFRPGTPVHNVPQAWRLDGALDAPALARAFARIAARHELLRTRFVGAGDDALQCVEPSTFELACEDLRALPAEQREAGWRASVEREALRPFDLALGPPWRAMLLRLSEHEHVLFVCAHHIAWDGWSLGVFFRELTALYDAFSSGAEDPLPPLAAQYSDFTLWQRECLAGGVLDEHVAYWRQQMAGAPVLDLPVDRPRPAVKGFRGGRLSVDVPALVRDGLRAQARRQGATLYMALLAGFQALLARFCDQQEVVVGTPTAGRASQECEALIGFFNNLLLLRTDLSGDPNFAQLLARVRETTLSAYAHQDLPFEQLVREVQPVRDTSRTPLCQASFALQEFGLLEELRPRLRALHVRAAPFDFGVSRFDLTFSLVEADSGLSGGLEYDDEIFDHATLETLMASFAHLLEQWARQPERPLSQLELATAAQRAQILAEHGPSPAMPARVSLAQAFAAQATRHAERVALEALGADGRVAASLTYAQLDQRAERLARRLRAAGVRPDTLVGLCLPRSLELIVGLLGIVKAGGAYVPLDAAYPRERLAYMLADADLRIVVADAAGRAALPLGPGLEVLDALASDEPAEACEAPDAEQAGADHLAYVMYTSGSTGAPKGAAITQRGVLRLVQQPDYVELGAHDVFLQLAPIAFDASTFEIWGALLNGARLVLAAPAQPDLHRLARVLRERRVSVLWLTAPLFHLMTAECGDALRGVRQVLAGGDVLLPAAVRRHLDGLPAEHRLVNGYGPTENTTFSVCAALVAAPPDGGRVPIGRAIAHTRAYVLDAALNLLPAGLPGELYLAGEGLARGYWSAPALTAERFVPDPLGPPGARLYRTGDRVRRLPDGQLDFLGRRDTQVKLRGHRVEPGEVEAALTAHEQIEAAAVVARGEGSDKRLLAYFVARPGGEPTGADVLAWLRQRLPEHMLPAACVRLPALPLTPSGKLERRALPDPDFDSQAQAVGYVAPRTHEERVLCEIWERVLRRERIGVHEDYFELGGDSMLSLEVAASARARGLRFELHELFARRSVAALAAALEPAPVETSVGLAPFALVDEAARAALPADVEDAYPLAALQAGMVFHGELQPDAGVYHDVVGYLLELPFDEAALRETLAQLARCHPVLRTSFDLSAQPEPLQRVHRAASVPLEVHDLRALASAERDAEGQRLFDEARRRPFEWRQPPLLRVAVQLLDDQRFRLCFDFHHAILDGWSEASLFTELLRRYQACRAGASLADDAPRASPRDYVALEREAARHEPSRAYWDELLAGFSATTLPRLPRRFHGGGEGSLFAVLPVAAPLHARLQAAARSCGVSLKALLLAVHAKALGLFTGQRDVLTGLVSHGRPETADGERALGLFLNTLPLRLELRAGSFRDLAQAAQRAEEQALPHRRYPLARVQQRHGAATLVETAFNYTHFHVYGQLDARDAARVGERGGFAVTNFALVANVLVPHDDGELRLALDGSREVFDETRLLALRDLYARVLTACAEAPEAAHDTLGAIPQMPPPGPPPPPPARCLHESFVEQVGRTPDAVAVSDPHETLRYAELDERANRVAHEVVARGLTPDGVVGLCVPRGAWAVSAILGLHKLGVPYLPLEPAYPDERLHYMLRDSGARLVVTTSELKARLPAGLDVLTLDALAARRPRRPPEAPARRVDPQCLAYVMYTSGSSGRPKGVALPHAGLANLFAAQRAPLALEAGVRVLQFASLSFDASVWELWTALLHGGALVVPPANEQLDPLAFARFVQQQRVSAALLPPSFLAQLDPAHFPGLRTLLVGGEACPASLAERWGAGRRLWNAYGPTEGSIYATLQRLEPPLHDLVPLGRPIAHVSVHVLDAAGQPAPVGTPGEMCLGGAGLARGYWRRPELTAERFVPDPFASQPGARLYRTGDLGRCLPDGLLEFVGRADTQVKLRGFRVELGEIEEALRAHDGVRDALVLAHGEGERRSLTAYVVPHTSGAVDAGQLQEHLRRSLPAHMLPAAYAWLEALPLTPAGKIDRRALQQAQLVRAAGEAYVAPRHATEERLARIYCDVLGLERVSVHDSFWDLGGHSLLLVRAHALVREAFGREVPLVKLLEHPSVAALAEYLAGQTRAVAAPDEAELARARAGVERVRQRLRAASARASSEVAQPSEDTHEDTEAS